MLFRFEFYGVDLPPEGLYCSDFLNFCFFPPPSLWGLLFLGALLPPSHSSLPHLLTSPHFTTPHSTPLCSNPTPLHSPHSHSPNIATHHPSPIHSTPLHFTLPHSTPLCSHSTPLYSHSTPLLSALTPLHSSRVLSSIPHSTHCQGGRVGLRGFWSRIVVFY